MVGVSALIDVSALPAATFDLWLKKNGVNIADSNTQVGIASGTTTQTLALSYILELSPGDYFEFFYHGSTTAVRIVYIAAGASPTRPASPSIIVTVAKIGM